MNKDTTIGLRIDSKSKMLLDKARQLSGVPVSEIVRRGALEQAQNLINVILNVKQSNNKNRND